MDHETAHIANQVVTKVAGDLYKDLAQPSIKRVGQAFDIIFKVGLSPLSALDFGFEQAKTWLEKKVHDRLSETPSEFIATPPNNVVFPAIKNIALSNDSPELQELYAELLLKALDTRTATQVHPSYVSIVEQLSPQEALALFGLREGHGHIIYSAVTHHTFPPIPPIEQRFKKHCAAIGLQMLEQSDVWLENLCRLGLLQIDLFPNAEYRAPSIQPAGAAKPEPTLITVHHRQLKFTSFGRTFVAVCTPPSRQKGSNSDPGF
jgi:hypothetical protein